MARSGAGHRAGRSHSLQVLTSGSETCAADGCDDRRCPGDRRHPPSFVRGARARPGEVPGRAHPLCRVLRGRDDHGFGFSRDEREVLVASEPDKFLMPRPSDMRYQWVCVQLNAIDVDELRELLVDAWRMCVPKKVAAGT